MKMISSLLLLALTLSATTISLPAPAKSKGMPLYEALSKRSSSRSYSAEKSISRKQLSQILWSAAGVNRTESGKRTSPSAWGNNEVEVYVLLAEGTYKYEPIKHELVEISKVDNRKFGGKQDFVAQAPVTFVMVTDFTKITQVEDQAAKIATSHIDAGFICQNIYLAAASEGLVTGTRAFIDKEKLAEVLKLKSTQSAIVANSLGYVK